MRYVPNLAGLYLPLAFAAAILVTLWGGFRSRLAVLILTFVLGGLVLNAQYSSEQIVTLLSLETPAVGLTGTFLLVLGVPLLVILFGNLYCGYVCPFGAAQELLGYLLPRRLKPVVPRTTQMRPARFVRYAVLFVLILAFFLSRNRTTLSGDPLIRIFSFRSSLGDPELARLDVARPDCRTGRLRVGRSLLVPVPVSRRGHSCRC